MRRWPPLPRPPDLHAHHHHRSHRQRGGVHRIQREHRPRAARVVPQGGQGGVAGSGRQVGQGVGGGKRWRGGRRQEGGARHHPNHGAPHWKLASGARQRPLGRGSARPDRRRTRGRPQGGRAGGESEAAAAAPRSAAVGRGHGARPLARPPPPPTSCTTASCRPRAWMARRARPAPRPCAPRHRCGPTPTPSSTSTSPSTPPAMWPPSTPPSRAAAWAAGACRPSTRGAGSCSPPFATSTPT